MWCHHICPVGQLIYTFIWKVPSYLMKHLSIINGKMEAKYLELNYHGRYLMVLISRELNVKISSLSSASSFGTLIIDGLI